MESGAPPINPGAPVGSPAAKAPARRSWPRRLIGIAVVLAVGVLAAVRLGGTDALPTPDALGGGPSADSVFADLRDAGLPITDGRPASAQFASLTRSNRCEDSRTFVRTDARMGWEIVCIGLDPSAAERLGRGLEGSPLLMGPLYADADDRDVIVFGLGWPENSSEMVHRALGDSSGAYLRGEL